MKRFVKNILSILNFAEKARLVNLIVLDVVISILDIVFLALLIYIIHFYTGNTRIVPLSFFPFPLFNKYPLLLIIVFLLLFALKNGFG